MMFDDFDSADLSLIREQLERLVVERGIPVGNIRVSQDSESSSLVALADVLSDPQLDSAGNSEHRRIHIRVTMFTESPDSEREVLWGDIWYCVKRKHSNFFPVPEDYGDEVTIHFNWEVDRETLEIGPAEVRDRESLHYASVLPSPEFVAFIECCSKVGEDWCS